MPSSEFPAAFAVANGLKHVLALSARGAPSGHLLQALAEAACQLGGWGTRSAIFIRRSDNMLELGASVGLGPEVRAALREVPIGPDQLTSGRAAASGLPSIVEDVISDASFLKWNSLSVQSGICAAWSFPLLAPKGEVLGTFTLYPGSCGGPSEELREEVGYFADVASLVIERQQLKERDEKRQRLYETFLQNTPDLASVFNLDKRLVYANERLQRFWGKSLEEISGKTLVELGYEPWHAAMREAELDQVMSTLKPVHGETYHSGPDGVRLYDYVFVPVIGPDGMLEAIAGSGRDITQRRAMEDALHASQAHLASLFEQSSVGIVELGLDGWLLRCNGHFIQMLGLNRQEVPHTRARQLVHADDFLGTVRKCEQLKQAGESVELSLRFVRSDGRILWASTTVSLVKGEDQQSGSLLAVVQDHTQLRAHEEELQQASRRKDEFLAMLAHELRNPLAPIACAADLLAAGLDELQAQEVGQVIQRQVRHMSGLVDDLLDVSRVTRGLVRLRLQPVDLAQVVRDAVDQARPLLLERHHQVHLEIAPGVHSVMGDPMRLVQVATNMLNNAAKYTEDGGQIRVAIEVEPGWLRFSVQDNGMGMEPEFLARAFDLFEQEKRTYDRSKGGVGLGLPLVKSLIELHGGSATIHSDGPGLGTEVSLRLPRKEALPLPALDEPGSGRQPAKDRKLRILVVDDEADAARMLAQWLRLAGHTVRTEHDPLAAGRLAANWKPDLCLLDIGMPVLDGLQLARQLQAEPGLAGCKLVAVTGYGGDQAREEAAEAGFHHHLVKPVAPRLLQALLDEVCRD